MTAHVAPGWNSPSTVKVAFLMVLDTSTNDGGLVEEVTVAGTVVHVAAAAATGNASALPAAVKS